jgi:hemoglobin
MENTTTTYEKIGGDAVVGKLCDRFYELMDTVPQFRAFVPCIRPVWRVPATSFTCSCPAGWGPDLFVEKFGHPRLRGRHMPFEIGIAERDQWVACMVLAMEDVGIEKSLSKKLLDNFFHTADFMRNKEG